MPTIDDVRVRGRDGKGAHRRRAQLAVGDVLPEAAAVGGLPHAAADAAEVERARLLRNAGHRDDPAAAERPDVAPLQRGQRRVVELRRLGVSGLRRGGRRHVLRSNARGQTGDQREQEDQARLAMHDATIIPQRCHSPAESSFRRWRPRRRFVPPRRRPPIRSASGPSSRPPPAGCTSTRPTSRPCRAPSRPRGAPSWTPRWSGRSRSATCCVPPAPCAASTPPSIGASPDEIAFLYPRAKARTSSRGASA